MAEIDNSWVLNIEPDIFTIIKKRVTTRLRESFPDMNFTMQDEEVMETKFPTVYIHFLPSIEVGGDTEGTSINGIICTVQYTVILSAKQGMTAARKVAASVIDAFKELRFSSVSTAEISNKNLDTVRMVGRMRRTIGKGDILN